MTSPALWLKLTQDTFGGEDPDWKRDDIELSPDASAKQWQAAVLDFERYFAGMLEDRQANPRDDLITTIVSARLEDGEPMPPRFQNHYVSGLAAAGDDRPRQATTGHDRPRHDELVDRRRDAEPDPLPGISSRRSRPIRS